MYMLLDQINDLHKKEKNKDNLFVNNIIVNKERRKKQIPTYISTEQWINQLCDRLHINL